MEGPGYSLFHGGENIRVNTSDVDDEEALERHKSIEKGLNDFLGDDLLELDETESSIGNTMYKHDDRQQQQPQPYTDHNPFYGQANVNGYNTPYRKNQQTNNNFNGHGHPPGGNDDYGRLRDALESKSREIEHISGLLMVEKKRADELEKRYKLSEAEKDRAYMQKQQFHDLLVEQKGRSAELDDEISNLKGKIKHMESGNTKLVCELESTRTALADCELKYRIIEKDVHTSRQVDGILKQENDRHTAHAYMLQQELSSVRNKLDDKELEVKNLHARYKELQKSRAAMVEEHSGEIRQLRREMDEFQRTSANASQENLSLIKTVQSLERENFELQQTIHQLTLRDKSKSRNDSGRNDTTSHDESLDYFKKNRSSIVGSTPINTNDEINRLKKELDRCTAALTVSKCEMDALSQKLQAKVDENRQLKEDENKALVEVAQYKEECQRLNGKLSLLDSELKCGDALEHQKKRLEEFQDQIDDLQKTNDDLTDECAKLRLCNEQLTQERDKCREVNEELKRQLRSDTDELKCERDNLRERLDDVQKECHELKNKYVEVSEAKDRIQSELNQLRQSEKKAIDTPRKSFNCTKCTDNKTLIAKLEIENVELQHSRSNQLRQIADLKESIKNLNTVVEMKKEYDAMLNALKVQAKEFSELVQAQNAVAKSSTTPQPSIECRDQSVSTTPDLEYHSEPAMRREIEMKMSQIMSSKMKRLEGEALAQMQDMHRSIELLTGELHKALSDVKMREKEVELLKVTLLAERKASGERLAAIQIELNAQNETLLTRLINENDGLKRELQEKYEIEMAERESVAVLKKQWHETEASLLKDIKGLKNVIGEFETEKSHIIKRLNRKYESAVKRGDTYKEYADAKDKHNTTELARIREEYGKKLSNLEAKYLERLETLLKEKEKEHTNRIIKLEEEWRTRLENYEVEFHNPNSDSK